MSPDTPIAMTEADLPGTPADYGPSWDTLDYRGYRGAVVLDATAGAFHGRVLGLGGDGVTFVGRSVEELRAALRDSVEDYLDFCRETGREPKPPGRFPGGEPVLAHLPPEACRRAERAAGAAKLTLEEWVARCVADAVRGRDAEDAESVRDPVKAAA